MLLSCFGTTSKDTEKVCIFLLLRIILNKLRAPHCPDCAPLNNFLCSSLSGFTSNSAATWHWKEKFIVFFLQQFQFQWEIYHMRTFERKKARHHTAVFADAGFSMCKPATCNADTAFQNTFVCFSHTFILALFVAVKANWSYLYIGFLVKGLYAVYYSIYV